MDIDKLEAGPELDILVTEIMEPKPPQTKTYRQLEQEDAGSYTCWEVFSPGGWWKISINWCDIEKNEEQGKIPDWTPAKEPSTDIAAAWEIIDYMISKGFYFDLRDSVYGWRASFGQSMSAQAESAPLAICKAALKAVLENA